jgi:hypothetical protein
MKRVDKFRKFRNEINTLLPGVLALPNQSAVHRYEDAIECYRAKGDRQALLESLMALGIEVDWIRWHAENRGAMASTVISP